MLAVFGEARVVVGGATGPDACRDAVADVGDFLFGADGHLGQNREQCAAEDDRSPQSPCFVSHWMCYSLLTLTSGCSSFQFQPGSIMRRGYGVVTSAQAVIASVASPPEAGRGFVLAIFLRHVVSPAPSPAAAVRFSNFCVARR